MAKKPTGTIAIRGIDKLTAGDTFDIGGTKKPGAAAAKLRAGKPKFTSRKRHPAMGG